MNLISEGLGILAEREIKYAARFVPPLMASYACHCFNLINREKEIFSFQGRIPDLRLQVLFTAPPGFAKSLFLKQMLKEAYGLVWNDHIPELMMRPPYDTPPRPAFRFLGSCTEAGWTGSGDGGGGNVSKSVGQAEKYANGIFAMEEFKAITQIMLQKHSGHLEQMINMSLFEGDVEKDLKGITISYHTDVTLWAGNQVMNFDVSGGIFRRFLPMLWIPRLLEVERLKRAIWEGDNIRTNMPRLRAYRNEQVKWFDSLKDVQSLTFDKSLRSVIGNSVHFEQLLLKNFALGYTLMKNSDVPSNVVVRATSELTDFLRNITMWRRQLLADPRGFQLIQLILDIGGPKGWVSWSELREKNLIFSTSFEETDSVLYKLRDQQRIAYDARHHKVRIK